MKLSEDTILSLSELEKIYLPIMSELELDEDPYFAHIRWIFLVNKYFIKDQVNDLRSILISMRDYFLDIIKDENFLYHQYDPIFNRLVELTNKTVDIVWEEYNRTIE